MSRLPWSPRPRVSITIPIMMTAIATTIPNAQPIQPTTGMNETTNAIPSKAQLISARIPVPPPGGLTIEEFGRIGAGAGVGAG